MKNIEFGRKVNKLRKDKGFTAESLAEVCDVTTATIRHVEAGRRSLSLEFLLKLCNALEVTADYLLDEQYTFERYPDKHVIYNRLDSLSPKQLDLLNEMITSVLEHTN